MRSRSPRSAIAGQTADLAVRVLRLERKLDSYQQLHADELAELRRALSEVKDEVLTLAMREQSDPVVPPPTITTGRA